MEISEFVKTVLLEVVKGMEQTKLALKEKDSPVIVNPGFDERDQVARSMNDVRKVKTQDVEMTIVVAITNERQKGGKGVIAIPFVSGEMSGIWNRKNNSVHTVKFTVPVLFPLGHQQPE